MLFVSGIGFFMHFGTATGNPGDSAYLESRLFYPNRGRQCLQFYMYNSGGAKDQLNVWVHEYNNNSPNGVLRLIRTFSGNLHSDEVINDHLCMNSRLGLYTRISVRLYTDLVFLT